MNQEGLGWLEATLSPLVQHPDRPHQCFILERLIEMRGVERVPAKVVQKVNQTQAPSQPLKEGDQASLS